MTKITGGFITRLYQALPIPQSARRIAKKVLVVFLAIFILTLLVKIKKKLRLPRVKLPKFKKRSGYEDVQDGMREISLEESLSDDILGPLWRFINNGSKIGYSRRQMEMILLKKGWVKEQIDEGFKKFDRKK